MSYGIAALMGLDKNLAQPGFTWIQTPLSGVSSIQIQVEGPCPKLTSCTAYTVCGIHKG